MFIKFIFFVLLGFYGQCFSADDLGQSLMEDQNPYLKIYELYNAELSPESLKDIKTLLRVKSSKPDEIWKQKRFFSVWLKKDESNNYPLVELDYSAKDIDFRGKYRSQALKKIKSDDILGLGIKEHLFEKMLLLDGYQDDNNHHSFEQTLTILTEQSYETNYSHIQTELKSWAAEIKAYEVLFSALTNSCLKNKSTNRYERIMPHVKSAATLSLAITALIYSLQSAKMTCYTPGNIMNTTLQIFNDQYAGKVNVTSVSGEFVLFTLLNTQSCYITTISPYIFSTISLAIAGVIFCSDLSINLHSFAYAWNLLFGINIEKPSAILVKRIFTKSSYTSKNVDEKKKFTDFMSGILPDLLKKRITEKKLFKAVDSVVSKYQ